MEFSTSILVFIFFLIILFWVLVSAVRNRVLFKMAYRNFMRKKGSSVVVIIGLMIGTAIISSSFTVGDTFNTLLASQVLDEMQGIDEVYAFGIPGTREILDFPIAVYNDLEASISGDDSIDGMEPELRKTLSVLNLDKNLVEPRVTTAGIQFDDVERFGEFYIDGDRTPSLPAGTVLVNPDLAEEIEARTGDRVAFSFLNRTGNFTVMGVLDPEERGLTEVDVFMNLHELQALLGLDGMVNRIHISNRGDFVSGMDRTENVKSLVEAENVEYIGLELTLLREKKAEYDRVFDEGFFFADLLLVFGSFTIIAGVILIINIFTMLGEERRSEMGMSRAIGMNKLELRRLFLYEGTIYGMIATVLGTLFGVVIGYIIIIAMGNAFGLGEGDSLIRSFSFTMDSLILALSLGFVITIGTIYYTTRKISEVNIIRAVRNLPEPRLPRKARRSLIIGIVMLIIGILIIMFSSIPVFDGTDNNEDGVVDEREEGSATYLFLGISLVFFSLSYFLRRMVSDRWANTTSSVLVLLLWSLPVDTAMGFSEDFFTFAFAGILMVTATVILIMSNSKLIVKFFEKVLAAGGCCQAVTRTALSYSLDSKFRTGLTIAMFSLVIFIITFMSVLLAIVGGNLEAQIEETSGGFNIMVKTEEPVANFYEIYNETDSVELVEDYFALKNTEVTFDKYSLILDSEQVEYPIIGIDDHFIAQNRFEISSMLPEFDGDKDRVFNALKTNREYVLADVRTGGSGFGPPPYLPLEVGESQEVTLKDGSKRNITVIGYIDTFGGFDLDNSLNGIFIYEPYIVEEYNATGVGTILIKLKDEADSLRVRQDIERTFIAYGAQSVDFKKEATEQIQGALDIFNILNAYLGLGLIIGIAGLGIITLRSVNERKGQIGMMRAIGYNKRQVLVSFLIESTYISFLGILIGIILGLVVSVNLFFKLFESTGYTLSIPGSSILIICGITLGMTLLTTIPPSSMAARIAPAEVLRYE